MSINNNRELYGGLRHKGLGLGRIMVFSAQGHNGHYNTYRIQGKTINNEEVKTKYFSYLS